MSLLSGDMAPQKLEKLYWSRILDFSMLFCIDYTFMSNTNNAAEHEN